MTPVLGPSGAVLDLVVGAEAVQIALIVPELPEVEHARRTLEQWLVGARIDVVKVQDARILDEGITPARVVRSLTGRRVDAVERRGKWLRLVLDEGRVFSPLGMTGKWVRAEVGAEPTRFEKVRFDVTAGGRSRTKRSIRYVDPRLFGRFVALGEKDADLPVWSTLGPDPLVDGIDVAALHAKLAKRKLAIKPTLLDQEVLAGVGNILATEALFMARIDPRRPARELSRAEVSALAKGIKKAIARTLALQGEGETIQYVEEAGAENPFTIYGQEGTPCPKCKRALSKMILGGRGPVLCAFCQR
jgi:formamidopyrimidine-DNA glycosylase